MNHQELLEKGYTPESFSIDQLKAVLPSFLEITPEMAECTTYGTDVRSHAYYQESAGPILSIEEIAKIMEEEQGEMPEDTAKWEIMKSRAERRQTRDRRRQLVKDAEEEERYLEIEKEMLHGK